MKYKRLFIFNPDCELAIANGSKYFMPAANIVRMTEDLALLPAWMGEPGDCVLVKDFPDTGFIRRVAEPLNFPCQPVTESEITGEMRGEPWGKSPKMCHWLQTKNIGEAWEGKQKDWYSRKTAREGLKKLLKALPSLESWIVPEICFSVEEIGKRTGEGKF